MVAMISGDNNTSIAKQVLLLQLKNIKANIHPRMSSDKLAIKLISRLYKPQTFPPNHSTQTLENQ